MVLVCHAHDFGVVKIILQEKYGIRSHPNCCLVIRIKNARSLKLNSTTYLYFCHSSQWKFGMRCPPCVWIIFLSLCNFIVVASCKIRSVECCCLIWRNERYQSIHPDLCARYRKILFLVASALYMLLLMMKYKMFLVSATAIAKHWSSFDEKKWLSRWSDAINQRMTWKPRVKKPWHQNSSCTLLPYLCGVCPRLLSPLDTHLYQSKLFCCNFQAQDVQFKDCNYTARG